MPHAVLIFLLLFYPSLASRTFCITISRHILILCAPSLLYAGIIFNTRIGRGIACCYDGGFLPFATLLLLFRIPFVPLCFHFYAGIIFSTRIGIGTACCYDGGLLPFATLLLLPFATLSLLSCYSLATLLLLFRIPLLLFAPTFMGPTKK